MCKIDSLMIIKSVSYELNSESGTSVNLELVPSDSYSLDATRNEIQSQFDKIGVGIISNQPTLVVATQPRL